MRFSIQIIDGADLHSLPPHIYRQVVNQLPQACSREAHRIEQLEGEIQNRKAALNSLMGFIEPQSIEAEPEVAEYPRFRHPDFYKSTGHGGTKA